MKQSYIYIVLVLMFFTSCKVGQKFEKPEMQLPETLSKKQLAGDSACIADLKWWDVYSDTILQKLIRKTLDNNKDIKKAAARVEELAALKLSLIHISEPTRPY